jgi:hypothetical protein
MNTRMKALLVLGMTLGLGAGAMKDASAYVSTGTAEVQLLVTYSGILSVNVDGGAYSTSTLVGYTAAGTPAGNPGSNAYAMPTSSITVVNNGNITARWEVDVSTIMGGASWTLNNATGTAHYNTGGGATQYACAGSCPGAEQYGFQALFVSSKTAGGSYGAANACPAPNAADWDQFVSTVPAHPGFASAQAAVLAPYLSSQYADSNATAGAGHGTGLPDSSLGLLGTPNSGDMLPLDNQIAGAGQRGLCVRMTMPSATVTTTQQTIQLAITAIGG